MSQLFSAESTGVYWFQLSRRTIFWPIICEFIECWQQIESGNGGCTYVQEGAQNRHLPSLYRCTASEENNGMYLGHTSLSKGALKNPIYSSGFKEFSEKKPSFCLP